MQRIKIGTFSLYIDG